MTFGGVPVPSFTVNSATQITVSVPAGLSSGQVDVAVTTPSGIVTVVNGYTYLQNDFASGDGTVGNPYVIANAEQLDNVRNHLDAHFVLSGDIDLDVAPYNTGSGWAPIGTMSDPFTGNFDGDGNTIDGLYINGGGDLGLFGVISDGAKIKDVGLEGVQISGDAPNVGGIVGYLQEGKVQACYVDGTIQNTYYYTGGLVGRMDSGADLVESFASTIVSGYHSTGGLVGSNDGSIEKSFAKGAVSSNFLHVGGLVGFNTGVVTQSYAWATVTGGTNHAGGLVGSNLGTIDEAYATGKVDSSSSNKGGLVGTNSGGFVINSYYDTETSEMSDTGKGTPLTNSEMEQQASFSGWDFSEVWNIAEGSGYPTLRWE